MTPPRVFPMLVTGRVVGADHPPTQRMGSVGSGADPGT
jgi:hypothetical protein